MKTSEISKQVEKIVTDICNSGHAPEYWLSHIMAVKKHAIRLYELTTRMPDVPYELDLDVILISALLHDISSAASKTADSKIYHEHHNLSAEMANKILSGLFLGPRKKLMIIECIRNHRGSLGKYTNAPESQILAGADAVATVENFLSLIHYVFTNSFAGSLELKTMDDCREWLLRKVIRCQEKMMWFDKPEYDTVIRNIVFLLQKR